MITNSPYQSHLFMNNIQVAIIEDEKPAARLLEGMIKKLRPQWDRETDHFTGGGYRLLLFIKQDHLRCHTPKQGVHNRFPAG